MDHTVLRAPTMRTNAAIAVTRMSTPRCLAFSRQVPCTLPLLPCSLSICPGSATHNPARGHSGLRHSAKCWHATRAHSLRMVSQHDLESAHHLRSFWRKARFAWGSPRLRNEESDQSSESANSAVDASTGVTTVGSESSHCMVHISAVILMYSRVKTMLWGKYRPGMQRA